MADSAETLDLLFGRLLVREMVGSGRHGDVFRVKDTDGGRYALKVLRSPTPELSERLFREGAIQSQLDHPNICTVFEVLHAGDEVGLLMELIKGPSLQEVLVPGQPWALDEALGLFKQLLSAIATAHQASIVHRDLTPANILLFEDESGQMSAKIIDFGFAKQLRDHVDPQDWDDVDITAVGTSLGTPGYVAPEQFDNARDVDSAADMFSLGAVLYELVCGQPAFPREADVLATMEAARDANYPRVDQLVPDVPFQIQAAIDRALSSNPTERFSTASEFALALWGEPLKAAPPVHLTLQSRQEAQNAYFKTRFSRAIEVLDDEFEGTRRERGFAVAAIVAMLVAMGLAAWRALAGT